MFEKSVDIIPSPAYTNKCRHIPVIDLEHVSVAQLDRATAFKNNRSLYRETELIK